MSENAPNMRSMSPEEVEQWVRKQLENTMLSERPPVDPTTDIVYVQKQASHQRSHKGLGDMLAKLPLGEVVGFFKESRAAKCTLAAVVCVGALAAACEATGDDTASHSGGVRVGSIASIPARRGFEEIKHCGFKVEPYSGSSNVTINPTEVCGDTVLSGVQPVSQMTPTLPGIYEVEHTEDGCATLPQDLSAEDGSYNFSVETQKGFRAKFTDQSILELCPADASTGPLHVFIKN